MRERSVYSINQRRRLEAETTHEREERLQQLSDNQQRKLDTETTALRSRSPHNALHSPSRYTCIYIYIDVRTFTATAHARRYAQT